jgi:hypothetical protein
MMWTGRLTLFDCAYMLDGGSIFLNLRDRGGTEYGVTLMQHAFPDSKDTEGMLPGRLYADGELVPIRSPREAQILADLAAAVITPPPQEPPASTQNVDPDRKTIIFGDDIRDVMTRKPDANLRALRDQLVAFVQSQQYLAFAKQVEQAQRKP